MSVLRLYLKTMALNLKMCCLIDIKSCMNINSCLVSTVTLPIFHAGGLAGCHSACDMAICVCMVIWLE